MQWPDTCFQASGHFEKLSDICKINPKNCIDKQKKMQYTLLN